ncbi:Flp family type IVb pilin [Acetobacter orientalis]|uniref:Flp family type IVb pilin n=1 Tax=Acetobacter orientalis TaxID=146474 RepID=UPI0020A0F638|nr:Flp family type IVb pilin [Acetobacter orientalis]MCP1216475.1 Flp family type IVb pilin [Acetobacter orientalis]MCP1219267.1 Flp family type IVb pilin [Acetobacter orientalis]
MIYYKKKIQQDFGATAIEYGLIASLIGVLAIGGISTIGLNLSNVYCTISKNIGGTSDCSSNSGSSNSGSGNVSLADGKTLADLKASLTDTLNDAYVDTSQGGTASVYNEGWANNEWCYPSEYANIADILILQKEQAQMEKINASDPITNVFGIYNTATGKPITDYNAVMAGIKTRTDDNSTISSYYKAGNGWSNQGGDVQVTTQSGKVYTIDSDSVTESAKK